MNETEFRSNQFDDLLGRIPDDELIALMRKIIDEVELRRMFKIPQVDYK